MIYNNTSTSCAELPHEVLVNVFAYLHIKDLCQLSSVSKKIQIAAQDDNLWDYLYRKTICIADSSNSQTTKQNCKALFLNVVLANKKKIIYIDNISLYSEKQKSDMVIYNDKTTILDLKSFIFKNWMLSNYKKVDPSVEKSFKKGQRTFYIGPCLYYEDYAGKKKFLKNTQKIADLVLPPNFTLTANRFGRFYPYSRAL